MNMIYIVRRLKEPSTYAGLITLAIAFNVIAITPEQQMALLTVIGGLLTASPDKQHD